MRASILLQYLLPHRFLSRLVLWATRWTWGPWKNFLIGRIVKAYRVDLDEAATAELADWPHFNAFFTRALKPGARPLATGDRTVLCPADGKVSQAGPIAAGRVLQAKGRDFSVAEFLADASSAAAYAEGACLTVYLSPRDYHRVHMPLAGTLVETVHVPGRLFSVAPFAVTSSFTSLKPLKSSWYDFFTAALPLLSVGALPSLSVTSSAMNAVSALMSCLLNASIAFG